MVEEEADADAAVVRSHGDNRGGMCPDSASLGGSEAERGGDAEEWWEEWDELVLEDLDHRDVDRGGGLGEHNVSALDGSGSGGSEFEFDSGAAAREAFVDRRARRSALHFQSVEEFCDNFDLQQGEASSQDNNCLLSSLAQCLGLLHPAVALHASANVLMDLWRERLHDCMISQLSEQGPGIGAACWDAGMCTQLADDIFVHRRFLREAHICMLAELLQVKVVVAQPTGPGEQRGIGSVDSTVLLSAYLPGLESPRNGLTAKVAGEIMGGTRTAAVFLRGGHFTPLLSADRRDAGFFSAKVCDLADAGVLHGAQDRASLVNALSEEWDGARQMVSEGAVDWRQQRAAWGHRTSQVVCAWGAATGKGEAGGFAVSPGNNSQLGVRLPASSLDRLAPGGGVHRSGRRARPPEWDIVLAAGDKAYAGYTRLNSGGWVGALFARVDIDEGVRIVRYGGRERDASRVGRVSEANSRYLLTAQSISEEGKWIVIDGDPRFGFLAGYSNYAQGAAANARVLDEADRARLAGRGRGKADTSVWVYAKRFIRAGTEIRWDYDGGDIERPFFSRLLAEGVASEDLLSSRYQDYVWAEPSTAGTLGGRHSNRPHRAQRDRSAFAYVDRGNSSDDGDGLLD